MSRTIVQEKRSRPGADARKPGWSRMMVLGALLLALTACRSEETPPAAHAEAPAAELSDAAKKKPNTPKAFTARATSDHTVELSWAKAKKADVYLLERKSGEGAYASLVTATSLSYNDSTAVPNTKYTYRLFAKNDIGVSEGVEVSVTTPASGGSPEQEKVNAYLYGLPSWESQYPVKADANTPTGPATKDESQVFPDPAAESKKTRYSCQTTPYSLTKTPEKIVTFSPDNSALWLGSLLQGKGYANGLGSLMELPIRERAPLKIYVDLLTQHVTETVDAPDGASVQSALGRLLDKAQAEKTPWGSKMFWNRKEASSSEEFALNAGLSVKYLPVEVKTKFNFARKANQHTVQAYFIQNAFTASLVTPATPAGWFSPDFTMAKLDEQIQGGRLGKDNLPVYVSGITYGRVMMFTLTSTASTQEIYAALDASYSAANNGVHATLDAKSQAILSNSEIQVVSIGGDDATLIGMLRSGDLYKYFDKTADLKTMKPISYQVNNVGNGSTAKFTETSNYNLTECSPLPNKQIKVGEVARLNLDLLDVPFKTLKGNKWIQNCYQFRFGQQGADAYGELRVDGRPWWQVNRDHNLFIPIGQSHGLSTPGDLPIETMPEDLLPRLPLVSGERLFLDGSGGNFQLIGNVRDAQGNDGDPTNTFEVVESYPFNYGQKTLDGNSPNCHINVQYTLEKVRDVFRAEP